MNKRTLCVCGHTRGGHSCRTCECLDFFEVLNPERDEEEPMDEEFLTERKVRVAFEGYVQAEVAEAPDLSAQLNQAPAEVVAFSLLKVATELDAMDTEGDYPPGTDLVILFDWYGCKLTLVYEKSTDAADYPPATFARGAITLFAQEVYDPCLSFDGVNIARAQFGWLTLSDAHKKGVFNAFRHALDRINLAQQYQHRYVSLVEYLDTIDLREQFMNKHTLPTSSLEATTQSLKAWEEHRVINTLTLPDEPEGDE